MFTTVFDIATSGYTEWHPALFGSFFVVIAFAIWRSTRDRPPRYWRPGPWRWFARFMLGFTVLWTLIATFGPYARYRALSSARREGRFGVVEGVVEDFDPMPHSGHKMEGIRVGHMRFRYSDFVHNGGFNHTLSHGGPIGPGDYVRISYIGGTIIKLEKRTGKEP